MSDQLRCPSCASDLELDEGVCAACGAPVEADVVGGAKLESSAAVDLHQLSDTQRQSVDEVLTTRRVRHGWQGTHLLVAPHLVQEVELAVDQVLSADPDGADEGEDETGAGPTVVYEVGAWPVAVHTRLAELLHGAGIGHGWEPNGDLVVAEADEDAVEELFDELDQAELDEAPDPLPILDDLHTALARLSREPLDARARNTLLGTAAELPRARLPFGFDPPVWRGLVASITSLAEQLPRLDAVRVRERATSVREELRSWL